MKDALQIRVGCQFSGSAAERSAAIFQLQPFRGEPHEILEESWQIEPDVARREYFDSYGNQCQRLTIPPGKFNLRYDAVVQTPATADPVDTQAGELAAADLPDEVLVYTSPSRYCLSDEMAVLAEELFGSLTPGYERVAKISDFVHKHLEYRQGTSTSVTTAVAAYENGVGVCRDFAHLAVTFCRALDIPARYTLAICRTSIKLRPIQWISTLGSRLFWETDGGPSTRGIMIAGGVALWLVADVTPWT